MGVMPHICLCTMCGVWYPQRPEKGSRSPEARVIGICRYGKPNSGPLEEQ